MLLIEAIVLGIVQGLTEFIPVSSSGHLIVIPRLLHWTDLGLGFDVALHLGTLVALVIYFHRDWASMIGGFVEHVFRGVPYEKDSPNGASGRLFVPVLVACVPAAVVGFLWDNFIETKLRHWYWVAGSLVLIALAMYAAEMIGKKKRDIDHMNYVDYISIGVAQALALFPGVSRSGITISAGMFRGLDRAAAARFSFLLSTPIILGAGMKKLKDMADAGLASGEAIVFAVGFVSAAASGYLAIRFLMNYLQNRTLNVFVVYRIAFAALLAAVFLLRI